VLDDVDEQKDLIARPATEKATADQQGRHDGVAPSRAYCCTV